MKMCKQSMVHGVTLQLASWVVVLAKLLVVLWLHYYYKILLNLILLNKFNQTRVNQALMSHNQSLPHLFWAPSENKKKAWYQINSLTKGME